MKKSMLNLGKNLNKIEQQQIKAGSLGQCSTYSGPYSFDQNSCGDFYQLPDKYKICVLVHPACLQ